MLCIVALWLCRSRRDTSALPARTWYRVVGNLKDGPPLVMIHGGPGAPWPDRLDAVDRLATHRPVVLYHQLGCGRSDNPGDPTRWTLDAFVNELAALRLHLGLGEVHLVGWSWGCMIALASVLADPTGVRSLVLLSPVVSASMWTQEAQRLRDALPAPAANGTRDADARISAGSTSRRVGDAGAPTARAGVSDCDAAVHTSARDAYSASPDGTVHHAGRCQQRYPQLGELHVPTLVISGRYDEATPLQMQRIVDVAPDARWVLLDGSAHCGILEQPDEMVAAIESFVATA